ncbi:MAG: AAA family ATPase [Candidatus Omnitrophica bacterium]|nr:AAA family ATPase [Candidatus Omnitrophota bacterium]
MLTLLIDFLTQYFVKLIFALIDNSPNWLGAKVFEGFSPRKTKSIEEILVDPKCGDQRMDLRDNRLLISSAFGSYFTGLLERDHSYVNLRGQVIVEATGFGSIQDPFQKIYWALEHSRGPQVILLAGQGGMGKSTLAAKIIRCLYSQGGIDVIIGDSAKTQEVNPVSGSIKSIDPAYYNVDTFIRRINQQLGLPTPNGRSIQTRMLSAIKDRLEGRRTIVVIDNLETMSKGADLLTAVRYLAGRDLRILITTRTISGLTENMLGLLLIKLQPIKDISSAQDFIRWHIVTHLGVHPDLSKLSKDLDNKKNIEKLIEKTGGVPLLIQLLVSDVARTSWDRLDKIPHLFGQDLLAFLYDERWEELDRLGDIGKVAQHVLAYVSLSQYEGKKITLNSILEWSKKSETLSVIQESIRILEQQFLLVNSDQKYGNYSIFPSLSEYLNAKV